MTITFTNNPAGDLVLVHDDGTTRVLDSAGPQQVAFVDSRDGVTTFGVATWAWERRWVAFPGGPPPTAAPPAHEPWLDWAPVDTIALVYVTTDDDGRLLAVLRRGDEVVASAALGTGRLTGLRCAADRVVVVECDSTDTTMWVFSTRLVPLARQTSPGSLEPIGTGGTGLILERDEPAATRSRVRLDLADHSVRSRAAGGAQLMRRRWIAGADGVRVPVDLVTPPGRLRGVLVISYGCYGQTVESALNPVRERLLELGVGYAVVRVRGGGDLGHGWWVAGRGDRKVAAVSDLRRAFDDLGDLGVPLIGRSFSAGAAIQLTAANGRRGRLAGLLLHNPFVRLVGDDGRPLDPEFGADPVAAGLCPTAAVDAARLPPVLITAGTLDVKTPWPDTWNWCRRALRAGAVEEVQVNVHGHGHDGADDDTVRDVSVGFVERLCLR